MKTRRLGQMQPSYIGMGGAWWHARSEQETIAAIEKALELGITFFDTYPGQNEERWGKALSGSRRETIYLQAKVSSLVPGESRSDHSADSTRHSVESSLKALRTEYLDSVLIHGYDHLSDLEQRSDIVDPLAPGNALDALVRLKDQGLIRHIGIGARSAEVQCRAMETGQIEIGLTYLEYNLLTQAATESIFPLAKKWGVDLILASPLAMGLLTGDEPDPEDEIRKIGEPPRAAAMWRWCRDREINIRHLALQYCLAAPIDGIVLPGQASIEQVEDSCQGVAAEIPLEIWRAFKAEFGVL